MKVLYLGYVWPEPASSAAGGRTLEILRCLRERDWTVIYASAAALSPHRFELQSLGIEECSIAVNDDGFDALLMQQQPDIVFFDRFFTEEQFGWRVEKNCPRAVRVLDTCDLHSLREARQVLLKSQLQQTQDWQPASYVETVAVMRQSDTCLREVAAILRCDLSLIISNFEYELLSVEFGVPSYLMQVNRLMASQLEPPSNLSANHVIDFEQRSDFLSIGNFRHAPNWDAVLCLKQQIWPKIRQRLPQAQLRVYGAYPPPKALQLHRPREGFQVLGWADDALAVMRQARVCLAPLRFGAGIKGKLADAMQTGTPSVTTSLGAEGMDLGMTWGGAVSDNFEEFAAAAVQLYSDRLKWQRAQEQGWNLFTQLFDREGDRTHLLKALESLQCDLESQRARNFVGAMLRHHSLKSTQYMSQWISLKNKLQVEKAAGEQSLKE